MLILCCSEIQLGQLAYKTVERAACAGGIVLARTLERTCLGQLSQFISGIQSYGISYGFVLSLKSSEINNK